jgi:hypothetical protein
MNAETIFTALNSPIIIAALAGLLLWSLNKLYASRPGWARYEGSIISAIKFAEQKIPDTVESKGLRRLDAALKYVTQVYEEANGRRASNKVVADLKEGIQLTHNKLEAEGTLKR